jgi:hypothetical protein
MELVDNGLDGQKHVGHKLKVAGFPVAVNIIVLNFMNSVFVLVYMRETEFHTHTKQQAKFEVCIF